MPPQGIDYILDEAHKRGLRVIPVLADYFRDAKGSLSPKGFLKWVWGVGGGGWGGGVWVVWGGVEVGWGGGGGWWWVGGGGASG